MKKTDNSELLSISNSDWDKLVYETNQPPYQQTSAWSSAYLNKKYHFDRVIYKGNDNDLIGTQILIKPIKKLGKIAIISQGPFMKSYDEVTIRLAIQKIKKWAVNNKVIYLSFDINYLFPNLQNILTNEGFEPKKSFLPPMDNIKSTLIIDLKQGIEKIFSSFKSSFRTKIRKGNKTNFKLRVGTKNDIELLYQLILETCKRRNVKPLYDIDFIYNLWDNLSPVKGITIHIADVNNQPVCASLGISIGNIFRGLLWGWNGKFAKEGISVSFMWSIIKWAAENQFEYFDFVHIDKKIAYKIKNNQVDESDKKEAIFGPTYSKMQFGGNIISYPGCFVFIPSTINKVAINAINILHKNKILTPILSIIH